MRRAPLKIISQGLCVIYGARATPLVGNLAPPKKGLFSTAHNMYACTSLHRHCRRFRAAAYNVFYSNYRLPPHTLKWVNVCVPVFCVWRYVRVSCSNFIIYCERVKFRMHRNKTSVKFRSNLFNIKSDRRGSFAMCALMVRAPAHRMGALQIPAWQHRSL